MTPQPFPYAVDFRGFWACPEQVAWIEAVEAEANRRGWLKGPLHLYQLIGLNPSSANTHRYGCVIDTANFDYRMIWLYRQMGADAAFHRPVNWDGAGGIEHAHIVLTAGPHNGPAAYQIDAVRAGYNGLGYQGHAAPDDGPRPLSGRTWQQGIAWAKEQAQMANSAVTFVDSALGFAADKMTLTQYDAWFASIVKAGHSGFFFYVSRSPSKCMPKWAINLGQLKHHLAALPVFEDGTDNPAGGAAQGHADAAFFNRYLDSIGCPKGIHSFAAFDRNNYTLAPGTADRDYALAWAGDVRNDGRLPSSYGDFPVAHGDMFDGRWKVETWGADNTGVHVIQQVNAPIRQVPGCDTNLIVHGLRCWTATAAPAVTPSKPNPSADQWLALTKHYATNLGATYPAGTPRGDYARKIIAAGRGVN